MKRPSLLELNAAVAVATHRSFRAAAGELGLSPPALSHAVASLERRIGVRLFHRTTRSVAPTAAGERFLSQVLPALRDLSVAFEAVGELRDRPTGTLRINTSEGAARQVLAPVVLRFLERYPDVKVEIAVEPRFVDIVKEGFDAGIRYRDAVPRDMVAVPCGPQQRFAVLAAPAYLRKRPRPRVPADLRTHRCICLRKKGGGLYAWEFERRGEEVAVDVDGPLILDSYLLVVEAVVRGAGLAYLNALEVAPLVAARKLVSLLEDWLPPFPGLCIYYPGHRHVPASLRAFLDVAKEFARQAR